MSVAGETALQAHDLALMHQKFLRAKGIFIEDVSLFIGADMHTVGIKFSAVATAESVGKVRVSETQGFYFRTKQLKPCLKGFENEVIVILPLWQ